MTKKQGMEVVLAWHNQREGDDFVEIKGQFNKPKLTRAGAVYGRALMPYDYDTAMDVQATVLGMEWPKWGEVIRQLKGTNDLQAPVIAEFAEFQDGDILENPTLGARAYLGIVNKEFPRDPRLEVLCKPYAKGGKPWWGSGTKILQQFTRCTPPQAKQYFWRWWKQIRAGEFGSLCNTPGSVLDRVAVKRGHKGRIWEPEPLDMSSVPF